MFLWKSNLLRAMINHVLEVRNSWEKLDEIKLIKNFFFEGEIFSGRKFPISSFIFKNFSKRTKSNQRGYKKESEFQKIKKLLIHNLKSNKLSLKIRAFKSKKYPSNEN